MDYQKKTQKYYDDNAVSWVASKGHTDYKSFYDEEITILNDLAGTGSILEIGIGSGRDSKILSRTYEYTGADISEGLIKVAQEQNPGLKYIQASVTNLPFEDDSFDNFFTAATLLHIAKDDMTKALGEIKRVVKNNGVGFITLKKGEGEELRENQNNRFFSYFSIEEFSKILKSNGFEIIKTMTKPDPREDKPDWIEFFVRVTK